MPETQGLLISWIKELRQQVSENDDKRQQLEVKHNRLDSKLEARWRTTWAIITFLISLMGVSIALMMHLDDKNQKQNLPSEGVRGKTEVVK